MIDEFDEKLIAALQADGRQTTADLSELVGLSQSSCHRRVRKLEEDGVITGYSAIVDRSKLGLKVLSYLIVKLDNHDEKALKAFKRGVDQIDEIVACYAVSGNGDYLLKIAAADMDAYAQVALEKLSRLPGVKDSESQFVLSTIKLKPGWPAVNRR